MKGEHMQATHGNIALILEYSKTPAIKQSDYSYLYVSRTSRFYDDVWDFSEYNTNNFPQKHYVFNFKVFPEEYVLYIKFLVLKKVMAKIRFSTLQKYYDCLRTITKELININCISPLLISEKHIKKLFEEIYVAKTESYKINLCDKFKYFVKTVADYTNVEFNTEIRLLTKYIRQYKEQRENGTTNYIPDPFLDQIVSFAFSDLNSTTLPPTKRLFSGLLIIMAETGMRLQEIVSLESGKLTYINSPAGQVPILHFLTFKTTDTLYAAKETYTFLTPIAEKAYVKCEEILFDSIDHLSERKKTKLCANKYIDKTVSTSNCGKYIGTFTKEQMNETLKDAKRYLFTNCDYGKHILSTRNFSEHLQVFFTRHYEEFDLSKLTETELDLVGSFTFESESTYIKRMCNEMKQKYPYEKAKEIDFYYTNPHSFRVTVCTKLLKQGVHLDYIMKHMNHLSADMTLYYDRSKELKIGIASTRNIIAAIHNKDGFLNTDATKESEIEIKKALNDDAIKNNIERINRYIVQNKINVLKNIDQILPKLQKTMTPVLENELGVCIWNIVQQVCEKRIYFNSADDGYHIGKNLLPTCKFLPYSYERFYEKLKIVRHNK